MPHVRQRPDFCGEACVEMVLRKLGHEISQDDVFEYTGLDPAEGRGAHTRDLKFALDWLGFEVGEVVHTIPADRASNELEKLWAAMHDDLEDGAPSIICMRYDASEDATEHFRLILGYDAETAGVLYHEPARDEGGYQRMPLDDLLALWPLKYDEDEWTVIRFRLQVGSLEVSASSAAGYSPADLAQHVMMRRAMVPDGFTTAVASPFVVHGNGSPESVHRAAVRTVSWAARLLEQDYFDAQPTSILDVWLFDDAASYEKYALELFDDEPDTPYGYYSEDDGALVMNIATGGGTLVHEMVHPYMAANFPACPSWFNEGLASLYEQCGEKEGHIYGYTNWRLAGLKKSIEAGALPTFEELLATSETEFYGDDRGTHYAMARYLCYYLPPYGVRHRSPG